MSCPPNSKVLADIDRQVEALRTEIAGISSREQLRFRISDLQEQSAAARAAIQPILDYGCSRKISVLQDRLIAVEGQETRQARTGLWLTTIGTVAGILGLVLGYYWGSTGCVEPGSVVTQQKLLNLAATLDG